MFVLTKRLTQFSYSLLTHSFFYIKYEVCSFTQEPPNVPLLTRLSRMYTLNNQINNSFCNI